MPNFKTTATTQGRYDVTARINKDGSLVNVYHGNSVHEATRITRFWDQRVDTYFRYERPPVTPWEIANDRFTKLLELIRYA